MRQCQRGLRDQHRVSPDRFRDADSQPHPPRTSGQRAQQRLILKKGVRAPNPPGGPAEVSIPQGGGVEILEMIVDEQGIQAVQPGHRRQHPNVAHRQVGRGIHAGRDPRVRHHVIPFRAFAPWL